MQRDIPEVHAQRIERLTKQVRHLEEQVAYHRARQGEGDELVVRLVRALWLSRDHGEPAAGSTPTDTDRPGGKPGSSAPKGGNPLARDAGRRLRSQVATALNTFETRVDNDWQRPDRGDDDRRGEDWPRQVGWVKCYSRQCGQRGRRVSAWRVTPDVGLEVRWECPECGGEYSRHPLGSRGGAK